jgi:dTDP-4-amino-4,6-dideoxygalactose transaminase
MSDPEFIPFHRPTIGPEEKAAVAEVLDSGWLTTGARSIAFEEAMSHYVGIPHAIAVNSATAALHLAFEGLGVGEGDEVIVPTYTFAASGETVLYLRARPVLVDVDPATGNVDPSAVEGAITSRTKAVEVVHVGGLPADMVAIEQAIARASDRLGISGPTIVEDAAHAFPSPITALGGRFAGTVGRAGAYSFYATKTITTGEGGMLVTADERLADRARQMRLHGISRDAWKRYTAAGSWYYEIEEAGFKDNLTDVAAAIGLVQLERAAELRAARAAIARRYIERLAEPATSERIVLPPIGSAEEHAWHLFVIRLGPAAREADTVDTSLPGVAGLPVALRPLASRRARVVESLREAGVGTSVHFIPLHLHPLYARMGYRAGQFPCGEEAYAGAISLPVWPGLSDDQVSRVAGAVTQAVS